MHGLRLYVYVRENPALDQQRVDL